jgi:D-alanyl-D-alanine carboxypeptidase (penicillin-binding protein 5/6)
MAMIMKAAVENDLCREIMSAHKYTTPETVEHPEGILISNWFLRRIEDKDSGGRHIPGRYAAVSPQWCPKRPETNWRFTKRA